MDSNPKLNDFHKDTTHIQHVCRWLCSGEGAAIVGEWNWTVWPLVSDTGVQYENHFRMFTHPIFDVITSSHDPDFVEWQLQVQVLIPLNHTNKFYMLPEVRMRWMWIGLKEQRSPSGFVSFVALGVQALAEGLAAVMRLVPVLSTATTALNLEEQPATTHPEVLFGLVWCNHFITNKSYTSFCSTYFPHVINHGVLGQNYRRSFLRLLDTHISTHCDLYTYLHKCISNYIQYT